MYFKTQKFLVVGASRSGIAATKLLIENGAVCYIYDDSESPLIVKSIEGLVGLGAITVDKTQINERLDEVDVVVLSPGVAIDHEIPIAAKKLGKRIIGELELGFTLCKSPIVAVTGTNGKTTTCTLIRDILNDENNRAVLCGNAGIPLSAVLGDLDKNSFAVAEVSSFQLETVWSFCPHIAVITNITPDHLSRHYNMENYIFLKGKILSNMRESEYAVLNHDDATVVKFSEKTKAKCVFFSIKNEVNGAYVSDGKIYYKGKYIMDTAEIPIGGAHNVLNVLASVCVAKIMGIADDEIAQKIRIFKGVKHRIQFIKTVDGVDYYNDSKATNADATLKAVDSMKKPTVLILGGKDKGLPFDGLFERLKNSEVKHVVLTGESRYTLLESAKKAQFDCVSVTEDFEIAFKIAKIAAKDGDCVLLSPACSSFDAFSDYEERGDKFISLVEGIDGGNKS